MGVSHRKVRDIARVPCSCTGMVAGVSDIVPVVPGCGGCRGICGSLVVPVDGNRGLRGYRLIPGGDDGHWPAAGMRFVALHTNVLHWEVCPSHRRKH